MKIADAKTIRAIDARAMKQFGLRGLVLMENAGRGAADAIRWELEALGCPRGRVSIIAGKGNNGGDGFVAARHLANAGARPAVFLLAKPEDLKGDALVNATVWRKMGGEIIPVLSARDLKKYETALAHSCVVVDAIFGTGLSSPVKGLYAEVIGFINGLKRPVIIAMDIPSGIDATTGAVLGCAVRADVTATMALNKPGLCQYPGKEYAGRIEIVDIGIPRSMTEDGTIRWNLITDDIVRRSIRPRRPDAHKGAYGHLLVIAGSYGMTGAAYMAATGAMRAGAGLATIALPESLNTVMEAKATEVMTAPLPEAAGGGLGVVSYPKVKAQMEGKSAVVFGPGIGATADVFSLLENIIRDSKIPMVIDADGLNCLAGNVSVLKKAKAPVALTPHPGEMSRLLGKTTAGVQDDRVGSALSLSKKTGATVVLKGAATVITSPDGQVYINPTGNAGLATAGTGDVLSGMIGGLMAQSLSPPEATVAAVYIHGLAADKLKDLNGGEAGMMATDLFAVIPGLINSFVGKAR